MARTLIIASRDPRPYVQLSWTSFIISIIDCGPALYGPLRRMANPQTYTGSIHVIVNVEMRCCMRYKSVIRSAVCNKQVQQPQLRPKYAQENRESRKSDDSPCSEAGRVAGRREVPSASVKLPPTFLGSYSSYELVRVEKPASARGT